MFCMVRRVFACTMLFQEDSKFFKSYCTFFQFHGIYSDRMIIFSNFVPVCKTNINKAMAIKITEECINCGACEPECPNNAIYEGGVEWAIADGSTVKGPFTLMDGTVIDADQ